MSKNKTVRKGFLSKILFLLALFILVSAPCLFAAVASCSGIFDPKTRYGTINGTCWSYHCATGSVTQLSSVDSSYCASCSGVKYAPSGSCGTCEYKCCSDGNWSGCNQACPDPSADCSSSQCWNGSSCENKASVSRSCSGNVENATGGTQTRTATCTSGSGWIYSDWKGSCTCKKGYKWTIPALGCVAPPDPAYSRCLGISGSTFRAYFMHNYSSLNGTPYNADYYYVIKIPLTRDSSSHSGSSCYPSYAEVTVDVSSSASGPREYLLSVQVPSGCKIAQEGCGYGNLTILSKGWK